MTRRFLILALLGVAALGAPQWASAQAVIGPNTPCQGFWAEAPQPSGTLTGFHLYLDPPASGPVIGVTPPTATLPATATTWSVCNFLPVIPPGAHTGALTAFGPGGESAMASPGVVPFSLVVGAPSAPQGWGFR